MKKSTIDMQVGIYDTAITARDYGHKICLTVPYVRWTGNTGTLDYRKATLTANLPIIRRFFIEGELVLMDKGGNPYCLMDYID